MSDRETKPVYVLHGKDAFLQDAMRKDIVARLVADADPQLCVATFDADVSLADVLDELRTLPFLAPYKVVIVRDADAFIAGNREALEAYLEKPARTASLVLLVSSFPSNTRLYKAAKKVGEILECSISGGAELRRWVVASGKRRGKTLASDAAELLTEWVGEDLGLLDSEIEKLSLYVGERETITGDDVSKLVVASAGPVAFALTNALTMQDARAALGALDDMLTVRGEELKVLGMLAWHLRKVAAAKRLSPGGKPSPDVWKQLRIPYHQQGAFAGLLRRRSLRKVNQDFRRLIAADLAIKSGADPVAAMQVLVVELCS